MGDIHTDNLERLASADAPGDGRELATGLMLMRASTLKVIRLQLAIERRDRRAVLEAVDALVELDTRLHECLTSVPAVGEQASLRRSLEAERSTLNREKLALVSGVTGKAERSCFAFEDADPAPAYLAHHVAAPPDAIAELPEIAPVERSHRSYAWVALLLITISVCAGEAYLFGTPDAVTRIVSATGAFQ